MFISTNRVKYYTPQFINSNKKITLKIESKYPTEFLNSFSFHHMKAEASKAIVKDILRSIPLFYYNNGSL